LYRGQSNELTAVPLEARTPVSLRAQKGPRDSDIVSRDLEKLTEDVLWRGSFGDRHDRWVMSIATRRIGPSLHRDHCSVRLIGYRSPFGFDVNEPAAGEIAAVKDSARRPELSRVTAK
jgi:hypothetical protein